ncbi:MAG: site-2 protease family protein [bacterium]
MDFLLSLLSDLGYWAQVLFAFGMLVVVHEFGHFIVGKWTGCRIDEFAIGFGPPIFEYQPKNSETLYALRWIPLGGYNRIWGYEDVSSPDFFDGVPDDQKKRAFINRPLWARALVLVAGSAFNFALAIIIVAVWGMAIGFPYSEIGEVVPDSPASKAGLQIGEGIRNFGFFSGPMEVTQMVVGRQVKGVDTPAKAEASRVSLKITGTDGVVREEVIQPQWNETEKRAMIGIVMRDALNTSLESVPSQSSYAAAGLRKGDRIVAVNGEPVGVGHDFYTDLQNAPAEKATVTFKRGGQQYDTVLSNFRIWNFGILLYPRGQVTNELKVAGVLAGSPAEQIGLKADDIITTVNGLPVTRKTANWEAVVRSPNLPTLELTFRRAGVDAPFTAMITPGMVKRQVDSDLSFTSHYMRVGPITAIKEGWQQTAFITGLIWDSLGKLVQHKQKVSELSGPVGIFTSSFHAAKTGVFQLTLLMVMLTINLGIFNLLPFPALDGGRLIFLILEAIFRKPVVDIRVENLIHVGGFLLLITFMLYVTCFDVGRLVG